jgi:6-phosphogluconolactonase
METTLNFDSRRKISIFPTKDEALAFAAKQWIAIASNAIQKQGSFSCALSGGSTPHGIYNLLATDQKELDWSKVRLFFSDERAVPQDHPDSNFRMAMESGLGRLPIPKAQIFPMIGTGDLEANALEYEKLLRTHLKEARFDLMMLGMGDDGHTASLFPKTHALHSPGRLVVANFIPDKNVWRLTVTYECINASLKTVVYVLGKGKAPMIKKVFFGPSSQDELPVQGVGTETNPAHFILDQESADGNFS